MLIDINMCCVQWLWLRQNHWTLNLWALIMNNHYWIGKGYTKNITRIVKDALHKLPGKSSLNIRSVCPVSLLWLVCPFSPVCPGCPVCSDDHDKKRVNCLFYVVFVIFLWCEKTKVFIFCTLFIWAPHLSLVDLAATSERLHLRHCSYSERQVLTL